jgi:tetratricopeptide (TPR) repeat protein
LTLIFITLKAVEEINTESARRRFKQKNYSSALAKSKRALTGSFLPGKIYFLRGRIFFRMGNFNEAIKSYNAGEGTYSAAALYYNRGLARLKLNKIESAKVDFKKAVMILPGVRQYYKPLIKIAEFEKNGKDLKKYKNMLDSMK